MKHHLWQWQLFKCFWYPSRSLCFSAGIFSHSLFKLLNICRISSLNGRFQQQHRFLMGLWSGLIDGQFKTAHFFLFNHCRVCILLVCITKKALFLFHLCTEHCSRRIVASQGTIWQSSVILIYDFSSVMEFSLAFAYKALLSLVSTVYAILYSMKQWNLRFLQVSFQVFGSLMCCFFFHGLHQPSKTSLIKFHLTFIPGQFLDSFFTNLTTLHTVETGILKILVDGLIPFRSLVLTTSYK